MKHLDTVNKTVGEGLCGPLANAVEQTEAAKLRCARWMDARFGCFVHWGPSALLGGYWGGKHVQGLAEWIQCRGRIPMAQYRQLGAEFNPTDFNAREWVRMAAEAGARYFVFTAKHHDGFAMYHSKVSAYNMVDATPFKRDPLAEIVEACREFGIMPGVYYSQGIDWEDPDAIGPVFNDWDYDPSKADFHRYWQNKAIPQLEELLTNYGDIGLVWFDMPEGIPEECAREASEVVRRLQPGAVINSRVGKGGEADYQSMDDNYFNNFLPETPWETAATTNEAWGYTRGASQWKPADALCEALAYTVSRGGNYLLNFGPNPLGRVPCEAVEQFHTIGRWMRRAAPGIHGAGRSPFPGRFEWGDITRRDNVLYLHIYDPAHTEVSLPGLLSHPTRAINAADGTALDFSAIPGNAPRLRLPPSDTLPRTVELWFSEEPAVDPVPTQKPGDPLRLDIWTAQRTIEGGWRWNFVLGEAGYYKVILLSKQTGAVGDLQWHGAGLQGRLLTQNSDQHFTLEDQGREPYRILHYWDLIRSCAGQFCTAKAGLNWLEIRDLPTCDSKWAANAVNLVGLRLERLPLSENRIDSFKKHV